MVAAKKVYTTTTIAFKIGGGEFTRVTFATDKSNADQLKAFLNIHSSAPLLSIDEVEGHSTAGPKRLHTAHIMFAANGYCIISADFYAEVGQAMELSRAVNCCLMLFPPTLQAVIEQGHPDDVID